MVTNDRERINQEMLSAKDLQSVLQEWGNARGETLNRAAMGIYSAFEDIHRRLIDEGWFGKTVHDGVQKMYDRENEKTFGVGEGEGNDYTPDRFYGLHPEQAQERERGIER
jgi:hypothetical protein